MAEGAAEEEVPEGVVAEKIGGGGDEAGEVAVDGLQEDRGGVGREGGGAVEDDVGEGQGAAEGGKVVGEDVSGVAREEVEEEVLAEAASAEVQGNGEGDGGVGLDGVLEGGGEGGAVGGGEGAEEVAGGEGGGVGQDGASARPGEVGEAAEAGFEEAPFVPPVPLLHLDGAEDGAGFRREKVEGVDDVLEMGPPQRALQGGGDFGEVGDEVGREAGEVAGAEDGPEAD